MLTRRQVILGLLGVPALRWLPGVRPQRALAGMSEWFSPVLEADRQRALAAAADRILPGVVEAGFVRYMNYWLSRYPYTNASDWRPLLNIGAVHLDRISRRRHGRSFADCNTEQQDALLDSFQKGEVVAKRFRSDSFFMRLVMLSVESFLSDPKYGGNKDGIGFKFIGRDECWWAPGEIRTDPRGGAKERRDE